MSAHKRTSRRMVYAMGAGIAAVIGLSATGGAVAGGQIGSPQIKDGGVYSSDLHDQGVRSVDLRNGGVHMEDLGPNVAAQLGASGLDGAIYRVANYVNGGGGYATVACADDNEASQDYVAISGGTYQARLDENGNFIDDANYPGIAQSFPGRMDWTTNTPKPDRLDGWVIKFNGGNATTLKVYAVCVPLADIEVQTTDY